MADILKKMNASRTDIPYSAMIEFAAKAEKEAKASAHQELLAANNKAIMANNKADSAEAERKHAEAQAKDMLAQMVELKKSITSLETKNAQLVRQIELEQAAGKGIKTESEGREDALRDKLSVEQGKVLALSKEVGELKGKLSVKPKIQKETKIVEAKVPKPIPAFAIDNVVRGPNDRIISATITPRAS
jgi:chromosome segregation ATPase